MYFCCEPKLKLPVLPDLKGDLSEKVPSSSINLMNNIVYNILDMNTTSHGKCGEYLSLTSTHKFLIGKCAAEDGVTATKKLSNGLQLVKFANLYSLQYNRFGDSPIYYHQSFVMQVFTNILPYQYYATYGIFQISAGGSALLFCHCLYSSWCSFKISNCLLK